MCPLFQIICHISGASRRFPGAVLERFWTPSCAIPAPFLARARPASGALPAPLPASFGRPSDAALSLSQRLAGALPFALELPVAHERSVAVRHRH